MICWIEGIERVCVGGNLALLCLWSFCRDLLNWVYCVYPPSIGSCIVLLFLLFFSEIQYMKLYIYIIIIYIIISLE